MKIRRLLIKLKILKCRKVVHINKNGKLACACCGDVIPI